MPIYPGFNICTFRTYVRNTVNGLYYTSTTYWEAASQNLTAANVVDGCNAYMTGFGALLKAITHSSCSITSVDARIFISGGVVEGVSNVAPIVGTVASGDCMPMSSTFILTKKTSQFGRAAVGHCYLAGVPELLNINGRVNDDWIPQVKAVASYLGADRTFSVPFHARHWDRKNNAFIPIQSVLANSKIGQLRSRNKRDRGSYL